MCFSVAGHTVTLSLFILSIMGRVGIKFELLFSAQFSVCPRLDRFQTPCLPNNLPGEESDQPRQKTRLTVPDCAVKEIRSLTERSYSISCLTDGGRWLPGENKDRRSKRSREKKKLVPEGVLKQPLPARLWSRGGSRGLFGRLTLKPQWTDLSLTSPRLEVNTEWPFITCAT